MIIRIVTMKFNENSLDEFLQIFRKNKENIMNFEGCHKLYLVQNTRDKTEICTVSHWVNEEALELYRNSELFIAVWAKTKVLFSRKASAISYYDIT